MAKNKRRVKKKLVGCSDLVRCGACETDIVNKLKYPMRDFDHIEEFCIQLYLDMLGHGINTQFAGIRRR